VKGKKEEEIVNMIEMLSKTEGYLGNNYPKKNKDNLYVYFNKMNKEIVDAFYNLDKTRMVHP
jgi:hypothetical protein